MFISDPSNNGQPSATLTFTCIALVCCVVAGFLEAFGKVKTTSLFLELFMTTSAMYLGRRFSFKGKNIEMMQNTKKEEE